MTFEDLLASDHINRTPYLLKMAGGDRKPLDNWIVFITVGVVLGGLFAGWFNGRVKVETNKGQHISKFTRWSMAFLGGRSWVMEPDLRAVVLLGKPYLAARSSQWAVGLLCLLYLPGHMHWLILSVSYGFN